jgi:hypothetical protein
MWVLTMQVNDCGQHGEYFFSAFDHKPSFDELKNILPNNTTDEDIVSILNNPSPYGNDGYIPIYFNLREAKSGEVSPHISPFIFM